MSNLAESWRKTKRCRSYSMPVSVRLRPGIDCRIQSILEEFPHLTQTQIINDLLDDAISRLNLGI